MSEFEDESLRLSYSPKTRMVLNVVPGLLTVVGVVQIALSIRIGIGELRTPGPGLWPAVTGAALVVAASFGFFRDRVADYERWTKRSLLIVVGIALVGLYIPFMLTVGFLAASAILTTIWLRYFSGEKWTVSIFLGVSAAAMMYGIFDLLLGVPLPSGPWGG